MPFTASELAILHASDHKIGAPARGPRPRSQWAAGIGCLNNDIALPMVAAGMTNQEIADLAGVTRHTVSKWRCRNKLGRAPMPQYPPRSPRKPRL